MNNSNHVVTVAVMGVSGSGKTEFINRASGSMLPVGHGLSACTRVVQMGQLFELDGRQVVLIDTPGFDDAEISEVDVLNLVGEFLALSFEKGTKLSGVVFLHRIHDNRCGGLSARTFKVYQKLCGESALKHTVILTNFWGVVQEAIGEAREEELRGDDRFFKPAIEKGAVLGRHTNTTESAHAALRHLITN